MPQLIEPTVLFDGAVSIGFVFIQGTGLRVGAEMFGDTRQMSPAAARRLAKTLGDTSEAEVLAEAIQALIDKADGLDRLNNYNPLSHPWGEDVLVQNVLSQIPSEGEA